MTEPAVDPPAGPPPASRRWRPRNPRVAAAIAAVVVILLAIPLWAPPLIAILPWGGAASPALDPELAARFNALEAGQAHQSALTPRLEQRLGALEAKPSDTQRLEQRLAALEARPNDTPRLEARIAALEARPVVDLTPVQQKLSGLADALGALTGRVDAVEKQMRRAAATDPATIALALVLLQIRDAVEVARPFGDEYAALVALARKFPDIEAAAAPLAEPAKTGVASRAVLIERLRQLAPQIASAIATPAEPNWRTQIRSELQALVVVRRVDGPGQSPAEAAVTTAQRDLAAGDLAASSAALTALDGAHREAAKPWLEMAQQRLAVETALRRIEGLVAAQLAVALAPADGAR